MERNKRFWRGFLCLLLALLLLMPALTLAEEAGESEYRVVIEDGADLLTEAEEAALRETMVRVLPFGNAAFVSTNENPTTAERYAESKFLEFFGDTSGALLLVDMGNRYIQLIADGAVYKTVTRARCNEITDAVYTYASRGDYAACATKAFEQVARLLEGGRIAAPFRYVTNALLAVCVALLGNFMLVMAQRRKKVDPENALNVKVAVDTSKATAKTGLVGAVALTMLNQRRTKHVESSSSGGGRSGGGGGGFSGGGGGGGFSGGGGGHRF